jgi:hypothetical protein
VKIHISNIAPITTWLLMELPSPPIFKIIRTYIPQLHKEHGLELPKWGQLAPLFKIVQNFVEYRNKLTHTGPMPEGSIEGLNEFLRVVSDLLYIFDVLEGHEWAKENVRFTTCEKLGWQTKGRGRILAKVKITSGWVED